MFKQGQHIFTQINILFIHLSKMQKYIFIVSMLLVFHYFLTYNKKILVLYYLSSYKKKILMKSNRKLI